MNNVGLRMTRYLKLCYANINITYMKIGFIFIDIICTTLTLFCKKQKTIRESKYIEGQK